MQVWRRVAGRRAVLAMALTGVLAMAGCSTDSTSTGGTNVTATPTFSPGAGSFNVSQTVTIADTTPGAVLYCTTDGTTPTTSSPQCSQPTTIFQTSFLQAIAVAPGKSASAVASAGYTINLNAAATPTFSPDGGSYTGTQQVTINDATTGANVYYTLDGSTPGPNSTLYTAPVSISKSSTLSAIAIASGFANSGIRSAAYTIGNGPAVPVIAPAGGSFTAAQTVALTDATPGATIYYTIDGSTPTSASTLYSGSFTVGASETVSAIAVSSGISSAVAKAVFTINLQAAAAPTFNPPAGAYPSAQQVVLNDSTPGASIFYTVDGSTPTSGSTPYNGTAVNVTQSETVKAIAVASGFSNSSVASAAYTISSTVPPPTVSPAAGTYPTAQSVTLMDTDANAVIYYTENGSTPTSSSTKYTGPINVSSSETVSAIAIDGANSSAVTTAAYTINAGTSLTGHVMSGMLPVVGSTVQLYAAGNADYASAATALAATAATTGADGSFTLNNINCPATQGDLTYVIATGGHTGSNTASNTSLVFMAALGSCNSALPTPVVNEVTTVASAYALSQFMTGATNVGSSAANYEQGTNIQPGLANAFATVNNLVDLTQGQARDHTPDYSTNLAGDPNIVNNSNVPQARINTLANALNACAVDGSGCSALFGAATPQSGTAPADTLQAILSIAQHPGNNASMVYNVATGAASFTPALSAAPNDWTLAITYTGGGLGFAPDINLPYSEPGTTFTDGRLVNTSMAIDATGNIWITAVNASRANTPSATSFTTDLDHGMVAKFNNQGKAVTNQSNFMAGTPSFGGYIPLGHTSSTNGGTLNSQAMAIDPEGNAWVYGGSDFSGSMTSPQGIALTEIAPGLTVANANIHIGFGNPGPTSMAIDGGGNVWFFGPGGLNKMDPTGAILSQDDGFNPPNSPFGYGTESLTFDSNGSSIWSSDYHFGDFLQTNPATNTATMDYFANTPGVPTPIVAGAALSDDSPGNVYACPADLNSLSVFNVSSASILATYPIPTGRGCGHQLLMDGAGHIFTITGSTGGTITPGIIDEFSVSGSGVSQLSPATGFTGFSTGEAPTINGDLGAPLVYNPTTSTIVQKGGLPSAAIDGSGNLWVLNADTGADGTTGANVLVEFIGLAAPVVTPTSQALNFGEVGVRP
jgi:hypothetical protein